MKSESEFQTAKRESELSKKVKVKVSCNNVRVKEVKVKGSFEQLTVIMIY